MFVSAPCTIYLSLLCSLNTYTQLPLPTPSTTDPSTNTTLPSVIRRDSKFPPRQRWRSPTSRPTSLGSLFSVGNPHLAISFFPASSPCPSSSPPRRLMPPLLSPCARLPRLYKLWTALAQSQRRVTNGLEKMMQAVLTEQSSGASPTPYHVFIPAAESFLLW